VRFPQELRYAGCGKLPEAGGLLDVNECELELNPYKINLQRVREAWGKVSTACYGTKKRHASVVICL
jgi:hypothetical protein